MPVDYFSHKPRSFLSKHADFDEKQDRSTPSHDSYGTPQRGRRPTRLIGYQTPAQTPLPILQTSQPTGPRVPRTRTLLRLLLLTCLATLAFLGWRCETFGCRGRGGGALVGGYVGGGSVVAGWGEEGGMDLSAIWDKPSWGGQRQGGAQTERSSAFGAQKGGEARDGVSGWRSVGVWEDGKVQGDENLDDVAWSGQLMQVKDGELVEWDNEEGDSGADEDWDDEDMDGEVDTDLAPQTGDADGVITEARDEMQEEVEDEVQQNIENPEDEALDAEDQEMPEEQYEAYEPPAAIAMVDGPVGELTGPDEGAVDAIAADASVQDDNINTSQLENLAYVPSSTTAPSSGWRLGSLDLPSW